ncbi:unnamed protein product, partial [Choristocarpus tenellus]
ISKTSTANSDVHRVIRHCQVNLDSKDQRTITIIIIFNICYYLLFWLAFDLSPVCFIFLRFVSLIEGVDYRGTSTIPRRELLSLLVLLCEDSGVWGVGSVRSEHRGLFDKAVV